MWKPEFTGTLFLIIPVMFSPWLAALLARPLAWPSPQLVSIINYYHVSSAFDISMVTYAHKCIRIFEVVFSFCCIMSVTEKPDLFVVMLGCVSVFYPYIKCSIFKPKQTAYSLVSFNSAWCCVGMCTVHASALFLSDKIHTVWNHCITRVLNNHQFYVKQILASPLW
jgi:hypothetical protein